MALVEWTVCGTVRGVVAAYLVYRAAREALEDTDLPGLVDAWEGFPGAPTSGSYGVRLDSRAFRLRTHAGSFSPVISLIERESTGSRKSGPARLRCYSPGPGVNFSFLLRCCHAEVLL